jgi:hypothetical protein
MNNADMPAMPNNIEVIPDTAPFKWPHGLTKLEHFAGLAMQAFIGQYYNDGASGCASLAVEYADALLKELEK